MTSNACQQRQRQMLFHIPPIRYNPISPYISGQYTQRDLDMRRKAEILEYNANKSNTKTNNFTRKEKWAQIANGNFKNIVADCSINTIIYTPTSSSGVPGPIINLYNDPTVPLYNYVSNVDAYASEPPDIITGWTAAPILDVPCISETTTNIASLYIRNNLDKYSYDYTISTPIAFYLKGTNNNMTTTSKSIRIQIDSITPSVKYNDASVIFQNGNPYCFLNDTVPSAFNSSDLSFNFSPKTTAPTSAISNLVYLGMLTINNMNLYTETGYIYDINVKCDLTITYDSNYFTDIVGGIYCNVSPDFFTSNNFNTSKYNYTSFSLTGE